MLTVRYFAWVRERVGRGEEQVALPPGVETVGQLIGWLFSRDEVADLGIEAHLLKAALDARLVDRSAPLAGASIVAIFPPMTGG